MKTILGWCNLIVLFLMDYFAGHGFIVGLAVFVTLMDAVWGIAVSIKRGKFTLSELARMTVAKLAVYGCALSVFVGLDKVTDTVITGSIVGSLIVLVEFWSCSASMLILFPYIPFLRLMKRALTGEIASKLNISEDDVEEVLNSNHKGTGRMRMAAVLFLIPLLFSSCKTKTVVVKVPEVRTDTTIITKEKRDSIWMRDSIYVHEWAAGDTVYVELSKWHTKYVERIKTDTIYKSKVDSIPVPYPVEKPVEKKLSWWQEFRMYVGGITLIFLLLWAIWTGSRMYLKTIEGGVFNASDILR